MTCEEFQKERILSEEEGESPAGAGQHLAGCAVCREFVRESERLRGHLRRLAVGETAPPALRRKVENLLHRSGGSGQRSRRRWAAIAAAFLLAALGAYGMHSYFSQDSAVPGRLAEEFINDHVQYLPGREQIVSDSTQQVQEWFKARIDFPVRVPEVPDATLEDARVCNIGGRKAALLHYRRQPGDAVLSLFIAEDPQALERERHPVVFSVSRRGVNSALWSRRGLIYDVVGTLDDASLKQIVQSVREQAP